MSTEDNSISTFEAMSALADRNAFGKKAGLRFQFGGDRDLNEALGYKESLTYQDYREWYDRGGIGKTIIRKPAETTWREIPEVIDDFDSGDDDENQTDFEQEVEQLFDASQKTQLKRGLRHYFERADILGRIGRYSVLFLGLADVEEASQLKEPVDPSGLSGLDDLLYLTPLGEDDASVDTWVRDVTDPRNGLPETYKLDLASGNQSNTQRVHHTRVIHIAEGILDDEVFGEPALRAAMNHLYDLVKVIGSSAEAYWMVSNPGLALSVDPEFSDVPTEKMDEQIDEYEHNLRRVMKLFGTDVEQLDAQDVDPEGVVDSILKLIAGTVEMPQRMLVGSERGELASSQDQASYYDMISGRQTSYVEPVMVRPFFDRMIEFGILTAPRGVTYTIDWANMFQLTELEEATLLKELSQSVINLSPMGQVDLLHSMEALREFSPIEEPEDAELPDEEPTEEIDEEDEEVVEQFERLAEPISSDD